MKHLLKYRELAILPLLLLLTEVGEGIQLLLITLLVPVPTSNSRYETSETNCNNMHCKQEFLLWK